MDIGDIKRLALRRAIVDFMAYDPNGEAEISDTVSKCKKEAMARASILKNIDASPENRRAFDDIVFEAVIEYNMAARKTASLKEHRANRGVR